MTTIYALFTNRESFNQWHHHVLDALSLPGVNRNALTGEQEAQKQTSSSYTVPIPHADGRIAAAINAAELPEALTENIPTISYAWLEAEGFFGG